MKTLLIILALLAMGCDEYHHGYNLEDYDLKYEYEGTVEINISETTTRYVKTGPAGITLHLERDSGRWTGSYTGKDQPVKDYCAPTAGKNILEWYDVEASYAELGYEMKTGNTEPGGKIWAACAGACGGEIAVCANSCYAIVKKKLSGSSFRNVVKAMVEYKPPGYEIHYTDNDPSEIEEIIYQLTIGNPVMIIEYAGVGHVSLITGLEIKDGEIYVVMANSDRRTLDRFMRAWSLIDSGNKLVRRVLAGFGSRPFTALWFQRHG